MAKVKITETVLRDAHQSLIATRMPSELMEPILDQMDEVGYHAVECWGGATFDACLRFLKEDPWERLRMFKRHFKNTKLQMLFRGQNILGYNHYADDVVEYFVEKSIANGIDIIRIFDCLNDIRNLETAVKACNKEGGHAQIALCYTLGDAYTLEYWENLAREVESLGADSLCIKDMAGLLLPKQATELVEALKKGTKLPIEMHTHYTTGMASMTYLKAIEAGADIIDTASTPFAMGTSQPSTDVMVAALQGTEYDTGLDIPRLEKIAAYFRNVRKKYAKFEGQLRGVDSRILVAQVPGGMLTNLENQLKQQNASDKLDLVLEEIPRVRKDLGYIPLVTPTSQIVGTQSVINVLTGERYKTIAKETAGILKGEYGKTPAPVDSALQARVLEGAAPVTDRPADHIAPEMAKIEAEVAEQAKAKGVKLADNAVDDALIVALFPQIAWKFLENRNNPAAFEPAPTGNESAVENKPVSKAAPSASGSAVYTVELEGKAFVVKVSEGGDISHVATTAPQAVPQAAPAPATGGTPVTAPMAGNIWKVVATEGQTVAAGDVLFILEAMKMETEVKAAQAGTVRGICVKAGDAVAVGDTVMTLV
mgnify:CR=1 FL=1